ncbi:MAG TPA: ABC transporter permease [Clostridiaceae bacterium]|nr:ABC transporter permease [Clostridiaceae bacterium]
MDKIMTDGLAFALPLFIMAIGGIYSERSGVTMLSIEGFQGFGAFTGAITVVILRKALGMEPTWLIYVATLTAILGGMLLALLNALMVIKLKSKMTIAGVVVNILAAALTSFLSSVITGAVTGQATTKIQLSVAPRYTIPGLSKIPVIGGLFQNMYPFAFIIIAVAVLAWYILYKTTYGLRLRAGGDNPHSLDAAGVDVNKLRFSAVVLAGGFAGLGGMAFTYVVANFSPASYVGYGYLAIAALIFGNWNIKTTFWTSMFFGFSRSFSDQLVNELGLSSNYSDLFSVMPYVLTLIVLIFFSKHNRPPRALGEHFDKGKR